MFVPSASEAAKAAEPASVLDHMIEALKERLCSYVKTDEYDGLPLG